MWLRTSAVAAALLIPPAFMFDSRAQAPADACVTQSDVAAKVQERAAHAELRLVDGELASRIGAGISESTGQAIAAGGDFLIVREPGAFLTYIVRFSDGCATHHGRFPDDLVQAWLDGKPI